MTQRKRKTKEQDKDLKVLTGEEVGRRFLVEFIEVYKGEITSIIPDEERARMVETLNTVEDLRTYSKYRDIYWHFLVKVNEYETVCAEARYWYLKLKIAIADGTQMKNDETDSFLNDGWEWLFSPRGELPKTNHDKIQTILARYTRYLYVCRCIEVGIEVVAQSLGISDSPFRGKELNNTYFNEVNKLTQEHKELKLKPIKEKDIKPGRALIIKAKYFAKFVKDSPNAIHDVFRDMLEI
jgi:hypothetical protein